MRDRLDTIRIARQGRRCRSGQNGRHIVFRAWVGLVSVIVGAGHAAAQDMSMGPVQEMGGMDSGGPVTTMGGGSYFSQDLGTTLRARFNTRSYGQDDRQDANLDIGTMQVVSWDDAIAFFDGQVTLSDVQGVGFNLGVGYRWLSYTPYATDAERVTGISLWGDGTSTEAHNFFPQLGVSFESLGDIWDLRANAYVPIGQDNQIGNFVPTGQIGFQGNFISQLALATVDQSFYVGEIELARRLGHERDAWGFIGPYELVNSDQDTTGVRAGVRGYAYPDLLLQLAVSHDDIFETNTTFSLTWFIGRTRTNFHPACGVRDRFREPVMRNDYVALSQSQALGGTPLTDASGRAFRVVHVDSDASGGGDGTFERPLNSLNAINANSQVQDIVFVHAESEFSGQQAVLLARQRFLGEGNGIEHTIVTQEEGTIPIPESSPGASDAARPTIANAPVAAVTITDLNEVSNFTITGGTNAIVAGPSGAGNPNLHDLTIRNTTGDAIVLSPFVRVDTNDADNDGNVTERTVAFNVNISNITFSDIGGSDINMNAFTNADVTDPNVTLQEAIVLRDITSTNGGGHGVLLQNSHSAGTFALTNYTNTGGTTGATLGRLQFTDIAGDVTITNADIIGGAGYALGLLRVANTSAIALSQFDYDGTTGAAGAIRAQNFDGTLNAVTSTFKNGTLNGISVLGKSDGQLTFQQSVEMTNLGNTAGGIAFEIDGGAAKEFTGVVSIANAITNTLGKSLSLRNMSQAGTQFSMTGNITDTGEGIRIQENTAGFILLTGTVALTTEDSTAFLATNNTGADINLTGDTDIITTSGDGFVATGGGTLTVSNTGNSVRTDTGQAVKITGMTVSNAGVIFGDVNRTASAATNAVQIENNTGGPINIGTVGDTAGQSGTIAGGTADAILIRNSANVVVSGIQVNNGTNASASVRVDKTNTNAMIVNLNDLELNGGANGLEVSGNGTTGNLNMTINDTNVNGSSVLGMAFSNVDAGTISVVNSTLDGNNTVGGTAGGVRLVNSNATFTFDQATVIREWGGTDFAISGGTGTVTMNGDIFNSSNSNPQDTTGRSVVIQNVSGGTITFGTTNNIVDDNEGMLVQNNTGGTINFLGTHDLDTNTQDAVSILNNTGATITIGQLDIDTTSGRGFVANGGGTLSVVGTTNTVATTAGGRGLDIQNMTIGAVDFQSVNVSGGADSGIVLQNNLTGTITVGAAGNAVGQGGTIQDTTANGVVIANSNATLNGVTVQNAGNAGTEHGVVVTHTNGNAMNVNLNRLTVNNTTAAVNGVSVDGAGGSGTFNVNLQNLQVDVEGNALAVANGATLTAGGTNDLNSTTGVGLSLTNITIAAAGANFHSVDVTNGTTNGVVMTNVTGGQVQIGTTGGSPNSGGSLTTNGSAIVLTNVQNVDLHDVQIINTGGMGIDIDHTTAATTTMDVTIDGLRVLNAASQGINVLADSDSFNFALKLLASDIDNADVVMNNTGAGQFGLLIDDTDVTADGTDSAVVIRFHDGATTGDVTIRNTSSFTANDGEGLFIDSFDSTPKNVRLNIQDSTFNNINGTEFAADIRSRGTTIFQATIQGNTFSAANATHDMAVQSNGTASAQMRLNLGGDVTEPQDFNTGAGVNSLFVNQIGTSVFSIFQRDDTLNDLRNASPVNSSGTFQNLATPPVLPTVPP